ncbi:MAG TPA: hypothetical protein VKT75_18810 [Acidobacteriaceae bacterium]|nr:hypothetical protein [Acidobacteriaceae bacterium]
MPLFVAAISGEVTHPLRFIGLIDLQLSYDCIAFVLWNLCQQVGNQILLPAVAENYSAYRKRAPQSVEPFDFSTERQRGHMPFNFRIPAKDPVWNEIILSG